MQVYHLYLLAWLLYMAQLIVSRLMVEINVLLPVKVIFKKYLFVLLLFLISRLILEFRIINRKI